MATNVFGLASADPALVLFFSRTLLWALGLAAVLLIVHVVRCAKRGVCPFPHRKKLAVKGEQSAPAEAQPAQWKQESVPLAKSDPARAALFADLQGNILSGHGRDHAVHLFVTFTSGAAIARAWLRETAEAYVVSAATQHKRARAFKANAVDGGIFGHISLSAAGYRALGFLDLPKPGNPRRRDKNGGYSDVFAGGMKSRQKALLDPEVTNWETGYRDEIHVLLILAGDNAEAVRGAAAKVLASLDSTADGAIGKVVAREDGLGLTRQLDAKDPSTVAHVEHFGYVDGRSQPLFLEEQLDGEKAAGGINAWDPSAPLSLALVRDPLGAGDMSFGSFLVFRKLEQNVRGFNRAVTALATELGVTPSVAGAMAMGRFKDGTPVVEQGTAGRTDVHNNFNFGSDPEGRRCPFQSHIRKSNPRGESVGEGDNTVEEERGHRIVRRGIPYGGELTTSVNPDEQPEGGVGLLFFCYQGDIWEQFEFIQRRWCNNPYFLEPQKSKAAGYDKTGLDPIVGQSHPTSPNAAKAAENWPHGWGNDTTKVKTSLASFVTMKGGEYFFSPSMSFLLGL